MWYKNALTEKIKIQYPIIQGPFGGGFSTAKLTAAVSNAGGLGSFGAHNLSSKEIISKVTEIRALTDKPFNINLWVSSSDKEIKSLTKDTYLKTANAYKKYFDQLQINIPPFPEKFGEDFEDQVEAVIETKPAVFSFVFGIPDEHILRRCRKNGIITVGAATTLDEAIAIEEAGVDCMVITGLEAGGHRPSFLKSAEDSLTGMNVLLAQAAEKIKIPIIAAGGISNAKGITAAKILGAQGFQLGTAFLVCEESGASPMHKEIIFSPRAKYTTLSRHYSGRLARFIENEFIVSERKNQSPYLPYPAQNYLLGEMKKASANNGQIEITPLYAGQGAPLLKHRNVKDLMDSLVKEISELRFS